MKPQNSAELLRNLVKAAVVDRGRRRALMRAMGLKSQGTITQWLDYEEHNPGVDKLDSIAKFLGCSVPDLFNPVPATTLVPESEDGAGVSSAPSLSQAAVDAATISSLKQKLIDLKAKYDELHDDVEGTIEHLSHHVGAKITTARAKEPPPRRHAKKNAG